LPQDRLALLLADDSLDCKSYADNDKEYPDGAHGDALKGIVGTRLTAKDSTMQERSRERLGPKVSKSDPNIRLE